MSDSTSKRTLTEISHLFLSSVRERQTGNAPRPARRPPPASTSIDLTPEEFAEVFSTDEDLAPVAPVTVVLSGHLATDQPARVRDYARHLACQEQRIGLIELDVATCRITCFEPSLEPAAEASVATETSHTQRLLDTLEELNIDVDGWILSIPHPHLPGASRLLRQADRWALLCTGDHDGIVAAYRTLKGLSSLRHPELSLAILDAADGRDADRVYNKLAGVCRQFLGWAPRDRQHIAPAGQVAEHPILSWSAATDQATHWQLLSGFIARPRRDAATDAPAANQFSPASANASSTGAPEPPGFVADTPAPDHTAPAPATPVLDAPAIPGATAHHDDDAPEVIELEGSDASPSAILSAVLRQDARGLVETPIRPPAFQQARLAVDRDRRLVLCAVAREGLGDLGAIGKAFAWLNENRSLIAMALPQLNVDALAMPVLRLLIDHADLRAENLQPLLAGKTVILETYRKLRWSGRTGLLLEAA